MKKLINRFRTWLFADVNARIDKLEKTHGFDRVRSADLEESTNKHFYEIGQTFTDVGSRLDVLEKRNKTVTLAMDTRPFSATLDSIAAATAEVKARLDALEMPAKMAHMKEIDAVVSAISGPTTNKKRAKTLKYD